MQFQPNLVSRETLLDAYHHPDKYKSLVVLIAGYCAHFNDLLTSSRERCNRSHRSLGRTPRRIPCRGRMLVGLHRSHGYQSVLTAAEADGFGVRIWMLASCSG